MKELQLTKTRSDLVNLWKTAKEAEKAWNDQRKEIERRLGEDCREIQQIQDELEASDKLTTTVALGDLKVGIGVGIKCSQADLALFVQDYPKIGPVLFKTKYAPDAKALISTLNTSEDRQMVDRLNRIVRFEEKNPAFSLK